MELERLIKRLTESGIDDGEAAEQEDEAAEEEVEAAEEEEEAAEEEEDAASDDDSEATPWPSDLYFYFSLLLAIGACPFEQLFTMGL